MKIIGLMVAQDEEVCVGMTIDTVKDIVDEIVFVDHVSKDRTAEIVREKCAEHGIPLHEYKGASNQLLKDVRTMAYENGKKLNPDWFFMIDADMVFINQDEIRGLAERGNYDQFWFRTMNLYGDIKHRRSAGLNMRHMWLFRNRGAPCQIQGVYICSEGTHISDPDSSRFIGWNLDGLKYYDHMFRRYQLWYTRMWNKQHGTAYSVPQFLEHFFKGELTEYYMKCFVLNRLRVLSRTSEWLAKQSGIENYEEKYMDYPDILKDWDCPFELIIGPEDVSGHDVIGRKPDLIDVPVLPNSKIYQLAHHERYRA